MWVCVCVYIYIYLFIYSYIVGEYMYLCVGRVA